jgi:predicted nucleic acid-binding protein
MRVVDTSAWIEFYIGTPLGRRLSPDLPARSECIVPAIVQLEIAKWMAREASAEAAQLAIADTQECVVIALDTPLALAAAALARQHRLATADAIIYATALANNADLLTCDAHFEGLPGVVYVDKTQGQIR